MSYMFELEEGGAGEEPPRDKKASKKRGGTLAKAVCGKSTVTEFPRSDCDKQWQKFWTITWKGGFSNSRLTSDLYKENILWSSISEIHSEAELKATEDWLQSKCAENLEKSSLKGSGGTWL